MFVNSFLMKLFIIRCLVHFRSQICVFQVFLIEKILTKWNICFHFTVRRSSLSSVPIRVLYLSLSVALLRGRKPESNLGHLLAVGPRESHVTVAKPLTALSSPREPVSIIFKFSSYHNIQPWEMELLKAVSAFRTTGKQKERISGTPSTEHNLLEYITFCLSIENFKISLFLTAGCFVLGIC